MMGMKKGECRMKKVEVAGAKPEQCALRTRSSELAKREVEVSNSRVDRTRTIWPLP
jgi:hypothetical protein